jgi:type I site-specific restriction endonuclease
MTPNPFEFTEADTCREYVTPAIQAAGDGMQQAKEHAEILRLKFAYATNSREIIEFDFITGIERKVTCYPTPDELWQRQTVNDGDRHR